MAGGVPINLYKVDDLIKEYENLKSMFTDSENPLAYLHQNIPSYATYYTIAPKRNSKDHFELFNRLTDNVDSFEVERSKVDFDRHIKENTVVVIYCWGLK